MAETTREYWRPVSGYAGFYEVSGNGLVRSCDRITRDERFITGRMLKQATNAATGYKHVNLSRYGVHKTMYVHRLVLMAFVGFPRPGMICCHNNGDPADNRLSNLRWDTHKSNCADRKAHGRERKNFDKKPNCKRGHPLVEVNMVVSALASGVRVCLACKREREAARWHKRDFDMDRANSIFAEITSKV